MERDTDELTTPPTNARPEGIGPVLRRLRQERGWNREALAYHSGLSWAAIEQLENGRRQDPRMSTLMALARALEVPVGELFPPNRFS
jgi:transcriptional regulator with XRE-family HTH domain